MIVIAVDAEDVHAIVMNHQQRRQRARLIVELAGDDDALRLGLRDGRGGDLQQLEFRQLLLLLLDIAVLHARNGNHSREMRRQRRNIHRHAPLRLTGFGVGRHNREHKILVVLRLPVGGILNAKSRF